MHWHQPQCTPCDSLPSFWINFSWQFSVGSVQPCGLCTFSHHTFPFQSFLHKHAWIQHSVNSQPFQQWPCPVSYMHSCQLSNFPNDCCCVHFTLHGINTEYMNVYIFVWNYEKKIKQNVTLCIRTVDVSELTGDAGNYVMMIYDLRDETGLNHKSSTQKINK